MLQLPILPSQHRVVRSIQRLRSAPYAWSRSARRPGYCPVDTTTMATVSNSGSWSTETAQFVASQSQSMQMGLMFEFGRLPTRARSRHLGRRCYRLPTSRCVQFSSGRQPLALTVVREATSQSLWSSNATHHCPSVLS